MEKFTEYSKTLEASRKIYDEIYGQPQTHAEWADSFNKIGRINEILRTDKSIIGDETKLTHITNPQPSDELPKN